MPIKLQKRSNILCLEAHFRLLEADKDPQSQKSCKKSEIFVFATGRSPRQERDPTKNAWTPLERAKVQTPTKQAAKPHEPARPTVQNLRKAQGAPPATTAEQTPAKTHTAPSNDGGANLTMEEYKIKRVRKTRGRNTDTARKTKRSAETSRQTLLKR